MGVYSDIKLSMLKFCTDFIREEGLGDDFQTFDFDTHSSMEKLPDKDVIGIGELAVENEEEQYIVTCMIAVCTRPDDAYLKRLTPAIDALFTRLQPGAMGPKVVNDKGQHVGHLKVMGGTMVLPVSATKTRPIQMVSVQLASSFLAPP